MILSDSPTVEEVPPLYSSPHVYVPMRPKDKMGFDEVSVQICILVNSTMILSCKKTLREHILQIDRQLLHRIHI